MKTDQEALAAIGLTQSASEPFLVTIDRATRNVFGLARVTATKGGEDREARAWAFYQVIRTKGEEGCVPETSIHFVLAPDADEAIAQVVGWGVGGGTATATRIPVMARGFGNSVL